MEAQAATLMESMLGPWVSQGPPTGWDASAAELSATDGAAAAKQLAAADAYSRLQTALRPPPQRQRGPGCLLEQLRRAPQLAADGRYRALGKAHPMSEPELVMQVSFRGCFVQ